jgi:hypothetical protein
MVIRLKRSQVRGKSGRKLVNSLLAQGFSLVVR